MEDPTWRCWGARDSLWEARSRLAKFGDTRDIDSIAVLSMKLSQLGFLTMVKEGLLTVQHRPESKYCVYGPLLPERRNAEGTVLYTVTLVG